MKQEIAYVKRLKIFLEDGITDPRQVANKIAGRFDVERIISHSGNPNFASNGPGLKKLLKNLGLVN